MIVYKCTDNKFRTVEQLNSQEFKYYLSDENGNPTGKRTNNSNYKDVPNCLQGATVILDTDTPTEDEQGQEPPKGGRNIAYLRISTVNDEQTFSRQEGRLSPYNIDKVYKERVSGSKTKQDRPELYRLLRDLRKGDTVYITEVARLSRSTVDLLSLVQEINDKGAAIKSLHDTWLDTTSDNPMSTFMLTMVGALAQLEREQTVQRVNEGLAAAKSKGTKLGRPEVKQNKLKLALKLYDEGQHTIQYIVDTTGISKPTLYRYLKERKQKSLNL